MSVFAIKISEMPYASSSVLSGSDIIPILVPSGSRYVNYKTTVFDLASFAFSHFSSSFTTSSYSISSSNALTSSIANSVEYVNILNKPALVSSSLQFTNTDDVTFRNITSSVILVSQIYSTGSNIFGNLIENTHQLTGSVSITGSLSLTDGVANLTSSWSENSITSSYILFENIADKPEIVSSSDQVSTYTVPITASIISASGNVQAESFTGDGFNITNLDWNKIENVPPVTASLSNLLYYKNISVDSDGIIFDADIQAGFKLVNVIASSSADTIINIGTSSSFDSIVHDENITPFVDDVPLGQQFFSAVDSSSLYVSSPSWGGNSVNLICKYERVIGDQTAIVALAGQFLTSSYAISSSVANSVDYNNVLNKPPLISSSLQFTSSDDATLGVVTASSVYSSGSTSITLGAQNLNLIGSLQISSSVTGSAGSITNYLLLNVNGVDYKLALYT
jgi:hypothetical protein